MESQTKSPNLSPIYAGEHVSCVAGAPCLSRFFPADPRRPLVVLIPGGGHNARIFYGGHPGHNPENFLTSRLGELGLGALAISYPFESEGEPSILPAVAPWFRIHSWGQQAAEVTSQTVKEHGLCGDVLLVAWSMGGRVLGPYARTATRLGLTLKLFVSLAATPGLPGSRLGPPETKTTKAGYATLKDMFSHFMSQIREQESENGGETIIPEHIYSVAYFGATPVSLLGWGREADGHGGTVSDEWTNVKDAAAHTVSDLPWMSCLVPTSILDARHVLLDRATWGYMMTRKMTQLVEGVLRRSQVDPNRWAQIVGFIHVVPTELTATIGGNHFFFLGKSGAKATATGIVSLLQKSESLRLELDRLLGTQ